MILSEAELRHLPRADVQLQSLRWLEGGRDLELVLSHLEGAKSVVRQLVFTWCSALELNITLAKGHGGYPLTWDVQFLREGDTWSVMFDFASSGILRLECNDIELRDGGACGA